MRKQAVILLGVVLIVSMNAYAEEMTWESAKPILEKAVETGYRAEVDTHYGTWLKQLSSLKDKEELIRLWILGADGSYTDLVIPGVGRYLHTYNRNISHAADDQIRKGYIEFMLRGLIDIFERLDAQIKTAVDFKAQVDREYGLFLEGKLRRVPGFSDRERDDHWQEFMKTDPKYMNQWPGFFSTQVMSQRGDRSYDAYHAIERKYLADLLKRVRSQDDMSLADYVQMMRDFPDRLRDAVAYMGRTGCERELFDDVIEDLRCQGGELIFHDVELVQVYKDGFAQVRISVDSFPAIDSARLSQVVLLKLDREHIRYRVRVEPYLIGPCEDGVPLTCMQAIVKSSTISRDELLRKRNEELFGVFVSYPNDDEEDPLRSGNPEVGDIVVVMYEDGNDSTDPQPGYKKVLERTARGLVLTKINSKERDPHFYSDDLRVSSVGLMPAEDFLKADLFANVEFFDILGLMAPGARWNHINNAYFK